MPQINLEQVENLIGTYTIPVNPSIRAKIQHEYDHLMGILYTSRLVNEKAFGFSEEIEDFWKNQNKDKKDNNEFDSN